MSPRQFRPFEATQPSTHRVETGRHYNPPARRLEIDRDASRVQGWILGSSWASSKTVDRKIARAPSVIARLRAWLKGGRP